MSRFRFGAVSLVALGAVLGVVMTMVLQGTENQMPGEQTALANTGVKSFINMAVSGLPSASSGERDVYYPGTEPLGPDEMRVIACGTGMEHTTGSDIAIHECFAPPGVLIQKQKFTPQTALNVGTQIHTSPAQFGKVMAQIRPRMAVGYHFFNDFDTLPLMLTEVRKTYDGPLALATDYMVFNVTKDDVRVRMSAIDEDIWPQPATQPKLPPDLSQRIGFSDDIIRGRVPFPEVVREIYESINEEYGTNVEAPQ